MCPPARPSVCLSVTAAGALSVCPCLRPLHANRLFISSLAGPSPSLILYSDGQLGMRSTDYGFAFESSWNRTQGIVLVSGICSDVSLRFSGRIPYTVVVSAVRWYAAPGFKPLLKTELYWWKNSSAATYSVVMSIRYSTLGERKGSKGQHLLSSIQGGPN